MIAALLLVVLAGVAQDSGSQPPPLERDPTELARAEPGRWEGLFDDGELDPSELPMELAPLVRDVRVAYGRRDFPEAVRLLYEVLDRAPDFPPSLLELGTIYFRLRRYGDAIVCLERLLEVAPTELWRTQALAHSYYSLGRHREALEHYRAVLEVLPDSLEAIRGLALSHYRLGEPRIALEKLDQVLAREPDHVEATTWKAQILFEEERSEEALPVAERARALDRFQPKPWYLLWQIHLDLGNDEEAELARREWADLDRLVQEIRGVEGRLLFRPDDYGLALRLAELQREVGNVVATREALELAVRNRPPEISELQLRLHVLDTLVELEDSEGAERAAEALGRHCADEAQAWKRLEVYYARNGNARMQVIAGERHLRLSREE